MLETFSGKEQANVETRGRFENGETYTYAPFLPGTHLVVCVATASKSKRRFTEKLYRKSKSQLKEPYDTYHSQPYQLYSCKIILIPASKKLFVCPGNSSAFREGMGGKRLGASAQCNAGRWASAILEFWGI
jgi:hypothetical protein